MADLDRLRVFVRTPFGWNRNARRRADSTVRWKHRQLPGNQRLTVVANATPTVARSAQPTPTAPPLIIEPPADEVPDAIPPRVVSTPSPQTQARYVVDSEVVDWANWLQDGHAMSWQLPAGIYGVEFTASGDGGTVEVSGSDCFKTRAMSSYRRQCELSFPGQIVITNPTVFATGKAISVTLRVVRLRQQ